MRKDPSGAKENALAEAFYEVYKLVMD